MNNKRKKFIVNFFDVDGCMVINQFPGGKMNADITKDPPFPWVYKVACAGNVNIMVSGRGSELKVVSLDWWEACSAPFAPPMYYVGVEWNHEAKGDLKMLDYVNKKRSILNELLARWGFTLQSSAMDFELHVWDDDEKVLSGVMSCWDSHTSLHLVIDGQPVQYSRLSA